MTTHKIIPKGKDGFYHPSSIVEIQTLVKYAKEKNLQVRCRGAVHSVAQSIYTDPGEGDPQVPNIVSEENPPKGPNINIMFDQFRELIWTDEEKGIVTAQAGINLGPDPLDPIPDNATLEKSLLYQAYLKGWTLEDLGGITHQTISGFLMTGSAGGTTMYTLEDNLLSFTLIDGNGDVQYVDKGTELFDAVGVSMGLLGIVAEVKIQFIPFFNIYGQEWTTKTSLEKCKVDLFGDGTPDKPSYQDYLNKTPYTRMLWWPQKGVDRVVTWEAVRGPNMPAFYPAPYEEFAHSFGGTQIEQLGASIMFTTLGNKGFGKTWGKLQNSFKAFHNNLTTYWSKGIGKALAWILASLLTLILYIIAFPLVFILSTFKFIMKALFAPIVNMLQPLTKNGKADLFMDYMWRSLPMDNAAGDILMGTEFTEIWIPIDYTKQVMNLLKDFFDKGYEQTGYYSTEFYAGKKSSFWMSPSYDTDVIRVDVFWYRNNAGNPSVSGGFYEQFWELFYTNKIPFRLHWGKYLPNYDYKRWAEYLRSQTPKWDDFMALRAKMDPDDVFYTSYWKKHLEG